MFGFWKVEAYLGVSGRYLPWGEKLGTEWRAFGLCGSSWWKGFDVDSEVCVFGPGILLETRELWWLGEREGWLYVCSARQRETEWNE